MQKKLLADSKSFLFIILVVTERHNFNGKVKRYEHRRILPSIHR